MSASGGSPAKSTLPKSKAKMLKSGGKKEFVETGSPAS